MANGVEGVIAALRVALREAEDSCAIDWPVEAANRWINELPGARVGRWRNLIIDDGSDVPREEFVGHVRATLAYLEANREMIGAAPRPWLWPFRRSRPSPAPAAPVEATAPIDADYEEVPATPAAKHGRPGRSVRLIKD